MKKLLFSILGFIQLSVAARAQNADRSLFIRDSLDFYINRALTNWRVPGAAVCIVKDGKVVLLKGYGVKELGLPGKVDENTLFMIGSNTEMFTAIALAMLDAEKMLSIDHKVTSYLPWFKLQNKAAGEQATIRDLLCQRIGFKATEGDFTFYNTNLTRAQVIEKLEHLKAPYPLRSKWGYTTANFLTAGEIIPKVTGKPWEIYLKDNILTPIGMNNTLMLSADMPLAYNKTVPHTYIDDRLTAIPFAQVDGIAPAVGMSSTISDMGKWLLAQLSNGRVGNRQEILQAAIQLTRQPQDAVGNVQYLNGQTNYDSYGLGWFLKNYNGHHFVMHDGRVNGYLSSVTLDPEDHLGIVILTNTDQNKLYDALRWEIVDAYLKKPFYNYSTTFLASFKANQFKEQRLNKRLRDSVALNLSPAMPITSYTGKYINELYGGMEITRGENNDLEMRFEHHTKMFVKLQPLGGNRFYATFSDPELGKAVFPFTFQNGRITGVKIKVADFIEADPYEFKKVN